MPVFVKVEYSLATMDVPGVGYKPWEQSLWVQSKLRWAKRGRLRRGARLLLQGAYPQGIRDTRPGKEKKS